MKNICSYLLSFPLKKKTLDHCPVHSLIRATKSKMSTKPSLSMSAAQGTPQAPQDARMRRISSVVTIPSWFKSVQLNGKHGGGDDVTNTEVGGAVVVIVDEGAPVRRILVKDVNNEDGETVLVDVGKTTHTPVVIEHTAPFTQNPHVFPELPHCPDVCNAKGTQLPFEQHPC
jgi:hypothetical protein